MATPPVTSAGLQPLKITGPQRLVAQCEDAGLAEDADQASYESPIEEDLRWKKWQQRSSFGAEPRHWRCCSGVCEGKRCGDASVRDGRRWLPWWPYCAPSCLH